jgi:hypothetical protein
MFHIQHTTFIWIYGNKIYLKKFTFTKLQNTVVKKPTITETIRLNTSRSRWFEHVQRMDENRIPKRVLYINLETTRLRGRPRNRWHDEVREDGRIAG